MRFEEKEAYCTICIVIYDYIYKCMGKFHSYFKD